MQDQKLALYCLQRTIGTTTLARHGFGGNCGWLLSLISNVPSLPNTRQSMKKRLLLLKPTLTKLLLNVTKSSLSMKGLAMRKMNWSLHFKVEVQVQDIIDKTN